VTPGTAAEFFLYSFLGLEPDISWRDVHIRQFAQEALLAAMAQGTIDAAVLGGNEVLHLKERLGNRAISWPAQWGLKSYWCLVTDEARLAQRPEAVRALLAALIAAEEELARRPELGHSLARQENLPLAMTQPGGQRLNFRVSLEQGLLLAMEEQAEWLGLEPFPNFLQWMEMDPLLSLSPQRVTVFR
jgi:ABC-type nitrate/sulfonate/bicarbonate transport system substrate-binding protein